MDEINQRISELKTMREGDRILTLKNYHEKVLPLFNLVDGHDHKDDIYIPLNTVTPSEIQDKFTVEQERKFRVYGCDLIQISGVLLKIPQIAISLGQAVFHRFYYRKSFVRCEINCMATASLFIACKVSDCPR